MKTKIEIIQETVNYYSTDPSRRATEIRNDRLSCVYQTKDGRNCALGRYLINPLDEGLRNYAANSLFFEDNPESFYILKPEARIEDRYFWIDVQDLHDESKYWTETGLSEDGKLYVTRLLEKYKN